MNIKWLTDLTVDELQKKASELPKPYKKIEIDGIAVCDNQQSEPLKGEVFKKCPHGCGTIAVSNMGRVKLNGDIIPQYIQEYHEHLSVILRLPFLTTWETVDGLVAETWCVNPAQGIYNRIHHISNNWYDNRMENLIWVTENQYAKIHQYKTHTIHGITIELGPIINILTMTFIPIPTQPGFLQTETDKLKKTLNTKIRYTGRFVTTNMERGAYNIYVFDELKYAGKIPEDLLSVIEKGDAWDELVYRIKYKHNFMYDMDAKKVEFLNCFDSYRDRVENGILKDIVTYDRVNKSFKIDPAFKEKHDVCKKAAALIIIFALEKLCSGYTAQKPAGFNKAKSGEARSPTHLERTDKDGELQLPLWV